MELAVIQFLSKPAQATPQPGAAQAKRQSRFFALCDFLIRHYSHAARAEWREDFG
jgi:hypothetical protein